MHFLFTVQDNNRAHRSTTAAVNALIVRLKLGVNPMWDILDAYLGWPQEENQTKSNKTKSNQITPKPNQIPNTVLCDLLEKYLRWGTAR